MIEQAVVKNPRMKRKLNTPFRLKLICKLKNRGTGSRKAQMSQTIVSDAVAIQVGKSARHLPSIFGRHDFDTGMHWKTMTSVETTCDTTMKTSKAIVSLRYIDCVPVRMRR